MTILTIIANTLGITPDSIAPGALLRADLGCDCLHLMSISNGVEEAFLIELSDDEVTRWETVECISRSVQGLVREAA
jgi:acyl carrier protein